jgi:hypothetical protein
MGNIKPPRSNQAVISRPGLKKAKPRRHLGPIHEALSINHHYCRRQAQSQADCHTQAMLWPCGS